MKKIAVLLIITAIFLSSFLTVNAKASYETNASNRVFSVSRGGDSAEFSENSIEAFTSAISLGFDAISAEVTENDDGSLVLKNSETTLSDVLKIAENNVYFIIDVTPELLDRAYSETVNSKFVFFRCREMKNKDLLNWANEKNITENIIPAYKGNVIFSAINTYNFAVENGLIFVSFETKNRYGVIYSSFFANRFGQATALASVYEPDIAGQRTDDVIGWENLLSLGYSAIETGNAREFAAYMKLLDESNDKLQKAYESASATDLSKFDKSSGDSLKKCLAKAQSALEANRAISSFDSNKLTNEIAEAQLMLKSADGKSESSIQITPAKIFWIIFALTLFIASQAYLHKKTNKK